MMRTHSTFNNAELDYLRLLAREYPTEQSVATEMINLNAILNLPKATEHFMSDIHGEYEAFNHIMRSASGAIREKIDILFSDKLSEQECAALATLIYYPEEKLEELLSQVQDMDLFYNETLNKLIEICHLVTSKYTRSKVRKALPPEYAYVIDELLNTDFTLHNKREYYRNIIRTIIDIGKAKDFIIALCDVIKRLIVDRLHIVGDIFDRGPRADIVMEALMQHHKVDIQWGNHDILWMGAAAGSPICIANVLLNSILYNNLHVIENGYGISLRSLALFANEYYHDVDVSSFATKTMNDKTLPKDLALSARMSKAISIILFKLTGQFVKRNPDFHMEERCHLDKIDYEKGTIVLANGKTYALCDISFPTINPDDPYQLIKEEEKVIDEFVSSFKQSEKLQKHVRFLFQKGSIYKVYNGNLLTHGGIPMNEDATFKSFSFDGVTYKGRALMDYLEARAREGYFALEGSETRLKGQDFMWYLWCGKWSPLFARAKMTTFERHFIHDHETWKEEKDPYYEITKSEEGCMVILHEFGLDGPNCHIINGHVPIKSKDGESPIKGNGRLFIIDGGFCKAYQKTTGIAGYTLIYNSHYMRLSAHEPFDGKENAIHDNKDILSSTIVSEELDHRLKISEMDRGKKLKAEIEHLQKLLYAYRHGIIAENSAND